MTLLGWKTVRAGERAAVWSPNGTVKIVDDPKSCKLFRQRLEPLRQHHADECSYLRIKKRTGETIIMPGPSSAFFHPLEDVKIEVLPALFIDASEALVLYRNPGTASPPLLAAAAEKDCKRPVTAVERRIIPGPACVVPDANEWIHEFSWTGIPKDKSKTTYQPGADKFKKLSTIPSQLYHNVNEVRTNDDTLVTVKLMIFFELKDIERMLSATADPISDIINAASADVVAFCSAVSYEDFLTRTAKMNELATFSQACARAEAIGYRLSKVVFRGFQAGDSLQKMHDNAISERTRLRLKEETEAQEQRAADLRLDAERARASRQAALETENAKLRAEISLKSREAQLAEEKLVAEAHLATEQVKLDLQRARNAEVLSAMRAMKEMEVDLTRVLVSQHEHPDRVLRIEQQQAPHGSTAAAKSPEAGSVGGDLLSGLQLQLFRE